MAASKVKNIFLSASVPLPERDLRYIESADIIAIRDSIIALATVVLPHHRIIWGGHPSITPLIYYVMDKFKINIQDHMKLYQSLWFKDVFPEDNNRFENVIFTEKKSDIASSIRHMRDRMFTENQFAAAVFIGGMNGVEDEFKMFDEIHPRALKIPISSTGAASRCVYDELLQDEFKDLRLEKDYGYMSLCQDFILRRI